MREEPNADHRPDTDQSLVDWLRGLRLGDPIVRGSLGLVPIYADQQTHPLAYRTLADGLDAGDVLITEKAHATVPTLQVLNQGPLPVLILDGEEVVGGLQNRVVNTTLLIPAKVHFDLDVSCVEHGRWNPNSASFTAGETAYPTLRRQKVEQVSASFFAAARPVADQGAVWDEIATRHRTDGVPSGTGAMREVYEHRRLELGAVAEALPYPEDPPVGVIALAGGRALCADIFDQATTLRRYWTRLVRSYALEAADVAPVKPSGGSAHRLLRRPLGAARAAFRSPGLGDDVRINGNGVVGAALVAEGVAVHVALFRRRAQRRAGALRSPGERVRRFYDC